MYIVNKRCKYFYTPKKNIWNSKIFNPLLMRSFKANKFWISFPMQNWFINCAQIDAFKKCEALLNYNWMKYKNDNKVNNANI